jgi:hypothetical protein
MPECPFCNIGSTYVIPAEGGFHCNNCGGNFDSSGEWMATYEEEDDDDLEWIDTHDDGSVYNDGRRAWPGFENVPW